MTELGYCKKCNKKIYTGLEYCFECSNMSSRRNIIYHDDDVKRTTLTNFKKKRDANE